jgi:hypothetical protein
MVPADWIMDFAVLALFGFVGSICNLGIAFLEEMNITIFNFSLLSPPEKEQMLAQKGFQPRFSSKK